MTGDILIPGGILSMSGQAADRLLALGSGDAALLYLHLLRGGDAPPPWPEGRLNAALAELTRAGLSPGVQWQAAQPATPPEPTGPPDYSIADVKQALEQSSPFSALADEVQRRLGGILSTADLKILYTIYDYLALPAEVILLLVMWCAEEIARKYGPGRRPTLSQIRKEAFIWHRKGVDTMEAAEAHLKRLTAHRGKESEWLALLGITGRAPVTEERNYLAAWADMGFESDALRLAYEKTVLKKQSLSWPYMNSILKSWHQKNLHTVPQIQAGDSAYTRRGAPSGTAAVPGEADRRAREDMDRMRRFLREQDQPEGEK